MLIPAFGCLLLTFFTNKWIPVMIILTLLLGTRGGVYAGRYRVPYEIAPDYPGPTYGFINTIAQCAGFVTPLITTAFTGRNDRDPAGWNNLFYLASGLMLFPYLVFLFCAKFDPVALSPRSHSHSMSRSFSSTDYGSITANHV